MPNLLCPPRAANRRDNTGRLTALQDLLRRVASALRLTALVAPLACGPSADASTAYGSLNNFDCVNDTGVEAHGFEIELDDVHSTDITYTYDWNHYGVPKITEDNTDPAHPRVFVRYQATRNPNGTWTAYTAVPAGPIAPTDGHQFTDPSVNFGGEHFGVGYYGAPTAVKYNWLIDDGTGALVHGPAVYIATPTFSYYPPAPAQPVPQVQAVIVPPPPPPAAPVLQFGVATWVKDIKTTTHNTNKVELADLVSEDPNDPNAKNWANGEPAEVETEWRILQTEFANAGNPKGELKGLPEDLPGGDEVVTRRYEFFKYVGPVDAESGEAMADQVGPDGIHGVGTVTYITGFDGQGEPIEETVDLSTWVVVGDFIGAQMSGFDVAPALGLIDHVPDGELNVLYTDRRIVIAGEAAFFATTTGNLPDGLSFDPLSGILSGTPTVAGTFTFTIDASDFNGGAVSKTYAVNILGDAAPPQTFIVTTSAAPQNGGTTSGDGVYNEGDIVTVNATANAGYTFVNWTEDGNPVSDTASLQFFANSDHVLVANFASITYSIATSSSPAAGGNTSGGGTYNSGSPVTVVATANAGYTFVNWTEGGAPVSNAASYTFAASGDRTLVANFAPITYSIATSSNPAAGGNTSGGGTYNSGSPVTVVATANAGYSFVNWTEGGAPVSNAASYTFAASSDRTLVANFAVITYSVATSSNPAAGGNTSGGGTYTGGSPVTVVATANAGYTFVNWTEAGAPVSNAASYTFVANGDRTLVANFAPIPASTIGVRGIRMPSSIEAGDREDAEVSLSTYAPAGGVTVSLTSSASAALQVPATVFIPAGRRSATFKLKAASNAPPLLVTITASLGNSQFARTVQIIQHLERD